MSTLFFNPDNSEFLSIYFDLLWERIANFSISKDQSIPKIDRVKDLKQAGTILLNHLKSNTKLEEKMIKEIANIVNISSPYVSNNYRKLGDKIAETEISTSNSENIKRDMQQLLYDYENTWKNLDIFEREARFHLGFIYIHPYEDGNGRTAQLLLNYNLLRNKQAPVVFTDDLQKEYQNYIKNNDIEGMKNLFMTQSQKEKELVKNLYEQNFLPPSKKTTITK